MHPVHRRLTDSSALVRDRLLDGHRAGPGPDTLLFAVEGDRDAYEAALAATDTVVGYDITELDDGGFYAFVREDSREFDSELRAAFDVPGVVVVPPVEFRSDGTARLTVVGEPDAIREAFDAVPGSVRIDVGRVGDYDPTEGSTSLLTDRQREAVSAALDAGYYDVPRTGDLSAVAERLGCAPGTASEHLRKAERAVLSAVVDRER